MEAAGIIVGFGMLALVGTVQTAYKRRVTKSPQRAGLIAVCGQSATAIGHRVLGLFQGKNSHQASLRCHIAIINSLYLIVR